MTGALPTYATARPVLLPDRMQWTGPSAQQPVQVLHFQAPCPCGEGPVGWQATRWASARVNSIEVRPPSYEIGCTR